ncbi:MAG: Rrf2 family transcriptional regulator [Gammaproteobacteria bacterium HGW-Gammaproteobacteria-7]|nr:MAG: Rrf2 family transcriptional regulator [Gammaproteobacteria bacterium HGW-Gammaproteobacteria-7]
MLSHKAKYALKALSYLTQAGEQTVAAHRIARASGGSEKFLEAILVELRNVGFVTSRRGPTGGYRLSRSATDIRLGAVIRSIDGPIAPLRCASRTAYVACADCTEEANCQVRHLMAEVREAMCGVLDRRTLGDFVQLGSDPDRVTQPYVALEPHSDGSRS